MLSALISMLPQMEEEEMLRVQIAVAKKSNCQGRPSSVDIYKRKVDSVKQKYEDQMKEMAEELAALKQEESNFYLDIATNLGKGAAERDTKPKALVTEMQCSINMSDVSKSQISKALSVANCKTPSPVTGLTGLFQQAENLFSDGFTLDQNAGAAISVNDLTHAALRMEATSSIFKFKKSTPTLMDAAAKENSTSQTMGFQLDDDSQRQQALAGKTISPGVGRSRVPGSKGGKPSFKFVSKASSNGNKGKSKFKSSGFLPVVVMGTEEKDVGGVEQMNTPGRKKSVFDNDFVSVE